MTEPNRDALEKKMANDWLTFWGVLLVVSIAALVTYVYFL